MLKTRSQNLSVEKNTKDKLTVGVEKHYLKVKIGLKLSEIGYTKSKIKSGKFTRIIGQGDLKVILPYEVHKVISLDIKEDINTHGSLKLKCIIKEDVYKKVLSFLGSKEKIEVNYEDKKYL